jgi:hypothetical protein
MHRHLFKLPWSFSRSCFHVEVRSMIQPVFLSLFISLFLLAMMWLCQWCRFHDSLVHAKAARCSVLPRCLKPRSPLDCPACCGSSSRSSTQRPASPVPPWSEVKSRRGAPTRVQTEGFACPNQACVSSGISDAHIHALLWRRPVWPC